MSGRTYRTFLTRLHASHPARLYSVPLNNYLDLYLASNDSHHPSISSPAPLAVFRRTKTIRGTIIRLGWLCLSEQSYSRVNIILAVSSQELNWSSANILQLDKLLVVTASLLHLEWTNHDKITKDFVRSHGYYHRHKS